MDEKRPDHHSRRDSANALNFRVPFFLHDLGETELEAFRKALADPILTTGDTVTHFEGLFSSFLGRKFTTGVTSATGALHLSLLALGIGPGDEVITTPATFIATSTAIMHAGAKPVFVDVEFDTGNIDISKIESVITKKTKAILPVHLYGFMADMKGIRKIADKHGLKVIEDCAHCIEGERDGIRPGQLSDLSCYSFFATKNLTCGEGGAVVTDDPALNEKIRLLRLHGMDSSSVDRFRKGYRHWDMSLLGWKYNMSNLQAALLIPQMDRIQMNHEKRAALSKIYREKLSAIPGVRIPKSEIKGLTHAYHLFTIWVDAALRDSAIDHLQKAGIAVTVNYRAIHLLTYFKKVLGYESGDFPVAEKIGNETISIPFYPNMPRDHVDIVVHSLRSFFQNSGH